LLFAVWMVGCRMHPAHERYRSRADHVDALYVQRKAALELDHANELAAIERLERRASALGDTAGSRAELDRRRQWAAGRYARGVRELRQERRQAFARAAADRDRASGDTQSSSPPDPPSALPAPLVPRLPGERRAPMPINCCHLPDPPVPPPIPTATGRPSGATCVNDVECGRGKACVKDGDHRRICAETLADCRYDMECGLNRKCAKNDSTGRGYCKDPVDAGGAPPDADRADTIHCHSSSECPFGFRCDYDRGRCRR
jgi:hypothetical protein